MSRADDFTPIEIEFLRQAKRINLKREREIDDMAFAQRLLDEAAEQARYNQAVREMGYKVFRVAMEQALLYHAGRRPR